MGALYERTMVETRGGRVRLRQLTFQHGPDVGELFGRKPPAYVRKDVLAHRHVLVDHA
ncbi:MAG: hypothetical protein QOH54_5692, partial [Mycobacterium sp.]|nr:hypothetical protein [Mycobacterium sp.]